MSHFNYVHSVLSTMQIWQIKRRDTSGQSSNSVRVSHARNENMLNLLSQREKFPKWVEKRFYQHNADDTDI